MAYYAHAVIEVEDGRYERGDTVPEDIPGFKALAESGSVGTEKPEPVEVQNTPPDVIEIEGVTYKRSSDGAKNGEEAR
jgi:hypothetical protein